MYIKGVKKMDAMRGNYFLGDKKFEIREIPNRALKAGEVLVRVKAAG